jgi:hypothetical protein
MSYKVHIAAYCKTRTTHGDTCTVRGMQMSTLPPELPQTVALSSSPCRHGRSLPQRSNRPTVRCNLSCMRVVSTRSAGSTERPLCVVSIWRVLTPLDADAKLATSTTKAIMLLRSQREAAVAFIHSAWPCYCCCCVTHASQERRPPIFLSVPQGVLHREAVHSD